MRAERGCKKPGYDLERSDIPLRFTSPILQGDPRGIMHECPVGYVLRESPQTYEFLEIAGLVSQSSVAEYQGLSRYTQSLANVYSTEKDRLREMNSEDRKRAAQSKRDANYGARVRKGR